MVAPMMRRALTTFYRPPPSLGCRRIAALGSLNRLGGPAVRRLRGCADALSDADLPVAAGQCSTCRPRPDPHAPRPTQVTTTDPSAGRTFPDTGPENHTDRTDCRSPEIPIDNGLLKRAAGASGRVQALRSWAVDAVDVVPWIVERLVRLHRAPY